MRWRWAAALRQRPQHLRSTSYPVSLHCPHPHSSSLLPSLLLLAVLVVFCLPAPVLCQIVPGTLVTFESPNGGGYNPAPGVTALQPWTWSPTSNGIAVLGSNYDASNPKNAPSQNQYSILTSSSSSPFANMSATISQLLLGQSYTLYYWWAVSGPGANGPSTTAQLSIYWLGNRIYLSPPNLSVQAGRLVSWVQQSTSLTASAVTGTLTFSVYSNSSGSGQTIIIDSVLLEPASYTTPNVILVYNPGIPESFESPVVNQVNGVSIQPYVYNPPITPFQHWTWTRYQGGIAGNQNNPWSPGNAAVNPPVGSQFAYLQVNPAGAPSGPGVYNYSNMSTVVSGFVPGQLYQLSFYLGVRSGFPQIMQMIVSINNVVIYTSAPNFNQGGWTLINSSTFALPPGVTSAPLIFRAQSSQDNTDSAMVVDAITLYQPITVVTVIPPAPPVNYPLVFVPNPCPFPFSVVPALVFPEYYASAFLWSPPLTFSASPFSTSSFTIQFQLNIANTGAKQPHTILQYGNPASPGPLGSHVNITWSSADMMVFDTGGGDTCTNTSLTFAADLNTWHLWTFTYVYTAANTATKSIYRDGVQVCTASIGSQLNVVQTTPLYIGNQWISMASAVGWSMTSMTPINLNNYLPASIADFRIYSRVLSLGEMSAVRMYGVHTNNTGLVVSYAFTEQSGTVIHDSGSLGLTLQMNSISWYNFMQQQPQWSGYYLRPLCLYTPTTLQPSGPASSPRCQAVNTTFVVTVQVLDINSNLVSAFTGGTTSLTLTSASVSSSYVTISPSSAPIINGMASFNVQSRVPQVLLLTSLDSGGLQLTSAAASVTIQEVTGVYFTQTAANTASAPVSAPQTLTVYAGACGGLAVVSGAQVAAMTVRVSWTANGVLTQTSPRNIPLNSSGYGTATFSLLSSSAPASVLFSLTDLWSGAYQLGSPVTLYWTSSSVQQLSLQPPAAYQSQQPSSSSFYAGTVVLVQVFAVDQLGGVVLSAAQCNVTVVISSAGVPPISQLVTLNGGVGQLFLTTLTAPGQQLLTLINSTNSLGPPVTVQTIAGLPASLVLNPANQTGVSIMSAVNWTNAIVQIQAQDSYGNVVLFSGQVNVVSSSANSTINGARTPQVVTLVNGNAFIVYAERVPSSVVPSPVILSLSDTAGTGLNVSSTLTLFVQLASSSCPAGTQSSGAVYFNSTAAGITHNTGDVINFGTGDFSLTVWAYVIGPSLYAGPNYFASQSYYPAGYTGTGSPVWNSLFVGPDGVPNPGGMTFDMNYYSTNATYPYLLSYNSLSVAQYAQYGQWVHWAFSFSASNASQTIYYNGALVGERIGFAWSLLGSLQGSWQVGIAPITTGANTLLYNYGMNYANVLLDDMRVYTRALYPNEPAQMVKYNVYPNQANLYMHYAFDEGTGQVMHDSVNHFDLYGYNNGVNMPIWSSATPNCLPTAAQVVILSHLCSAAARVVTSPSHCSHWTCREIHPSPSMAGLRSFCRAAPPPPLSCTPAVAL